MVVLPWILVEEGAEGTQGLDRACQVAGHREEDLDLEVEEAERLECTELARCKALLGMAKDLCEMAEEVSLAHWCMREEALALGLAGEGCCEKDDPCCRMG